MLNPEKIQQKEKPAIILQLGDGTYYYNYNIQPITITTYREDKEETVNGWEFVLAYIYGNPEYKACVKAIIRKYVTLEEEFDLINSYNKAIIEKDIDSPDISRYQEYLNIIDLIKKEVKINLK